MDNIYHSLASILHHNPNHHKPQTPTNNHQPILEKFAAAFAANQNMSEHPQALNRFINYMHEQRFVKLIPEFFNDLASVQILCCNEEKVYNFNPQFRAYCIHGRAVSVLKRKSREIESERKDLYQEIESAVFSLHEQNLFPLSKNESHDIDDVLLHFTIPNEVDPIILSNEVFSPFVPQPFAIVIVLPFAWPKPEALNHFLRSSLLHMYIDNANLLNKVVYRQTFYKHSIVKGIYFVEEGEVQSTNGRIVARGWVTNGKCKNSGYGWKFKPLTFFRSLAKNQNFWKQFVNDLHLNGQYPFKMSYLLGIENEVLGFQNYQGKGKRTKLPKIVHSSFDYGKLTQIQKVKHYDERISELCQFKEKFILKRNEDSLKRSTDHARERQKKDKRVYLKHLSTQKYIQKNSSSENILIMSVLKRLQGLTDLNSGQQQIRKKQKFRISPAKLFQQSRLTKKKRYDQ